MTAYRYRPGRYRLRRRNGNAEKLTGLGVGLFLAVAVAGHAATGHHAPGHAAASVADAAVPAAIAPVTSGSETAFWDATLADLGAPASPADTTSLADWASREGPWGSVGQHNPLDTTMPEPGSWAFNTFGGGLHVQSYPTASEGAQATALTLEGGYPTIVAALRSGSGICGPGFTGPLDEWSGGGYQEVC